MNIVKGTVQAIKTNSKGQSFCRLLSDNNVTLQFCSPDDKFSGVVLKEKDYVMIKYSGEEATKGWYLTSNVVVGDEQLKGIGEKNITSTDNTTSQKIHVSRPKQDSWEVKAVKMAFGNAMNVANKIIGGTAKKNPDPKYVAEKALELVFEANKLRGELLEKFPSRTEQDVGAKLGDALKNVALKGMATEKLLDEAQQYVEAHIAAEERLFGGGGMINTL